jgi:hypothetical protein
LPGDIRRVADTDTKVLNFRCLIERAKSLERFLSPTEKST